MSISNWHFNSVCATQFPTALNRFHKIIAIIDFQNFSLEHLMCFVGKAFNLNTIILENQSASFYQFIRIILCFIYIQTTILLILSKSEIEISSIR